MRFGENNLLGTIYINFGGFVGGGEEGYMVQITFFCLLYLKFEKVQEHEIY